MTHEPSSHPSRSPVPRLVSRVYGAASRPLRAELLRCLLKPLGPLGLAAVAAGAFASLWQRDGVRVGMADAARFSSQQIAELARFVQQVDPQALQQFAQLTAQHAGSIGGFGAAAVWLLLRRLGP